MTILLTEQNVNFAMSLAQEVYLLETGRIGPRSTPAALRNSPEIAAAYFGALWALGLIRQTERLAHPDADGEGKALELARLPQRVRRTSRWPHG